MSPLPPPYDDVVRDVQTYLGMSADDPELELEIQRFLDRWPVRHLDADLPERFKRRCWNTVGMLAERLAVNTNLFQLLSPEALAQVLSFGYYCLILGFRLRRSDD